MKKSTNNVVGVLSALAWMAVFLFPFLILFWFWFIAPFKLEQYTRLPDWVCGIIGVIVGVLLAGAYIVLVWPRMLGYSRPRDAASQSGGSPLFRPPESTDSDSSETVEQSTEVRDSDASRAPQASADVT